MPKKGKRGNKKSKKINKLTNTLAIVALLLNVFILPGLGSLIARRKREGIWQLVLFLIGIPLIFFVVGPILMTIAWVWALITGIKIVKKAK